MNIKDLRLTPEQQAIYEKGMEAEKIMRKLKGEPEPKTLVEIAEDMARPLKEFCTENNLDIGWMTQISTGKKFKSLSNYYCIVDNNQSDNEIYSEIDKIKEKDKEVKQNWLEKTRTRQRYECIYCNKLVTKSNLTRWHNDKCKENVSL